MVYISDDDLPKIVETDANNLGWGAILKQVKEQGGKKREEIVQFSSRLWQSSEKNYSPLDKEIKASLNAIHKFEIFLIYKKFLLRTDVAAMNKVLNKEIKTPSDAKFARWQALFSNFDFSIEHIKGTTNCIPDFLSREHLQQVSMIISVQLRNGSEILTTILDTFSWEQYSSNWKPHWELRSTKLISPTNQFHCSRLVPEVCNWQSSNVLIPVISRASQKVVEAQDALSSIFHDIYLIWDIRNNQGFNQQYFCLQRPRLLCHWPERNQALYFPGSDYDYSHYKTLWWDLI